VFRISIRGSLELCLGGLIPPNPPPRGDGTGSVARFVCRKIIEHTM